MHHEGTDKRVTHVSPLGELALGPVDVAVSAEGADTAAAVAAPPLDFVPCNNVTLVRTNITGTYRSDACQKDCLDATGHPYPTLMCLNCSQIPNQEDFRKRA